MCPSSGSTGFSIPSRAAPPDPASLAGNLLKVTALPPAPTPAQPRPQVVLTGMGTAGGVCVDPGVAVWVTDRTPLEDRLGRGSVGGAGSAPVWGWPGRAQRWSLWGPWRAAA